MSGLLQLQVGSLFAGDFRIVRPLSEGGMGAVYVVEQLSTGKERALKVMQPALVTNDKLRERFAQEARVASRIESEHVVEVVGAGVDAATGTPWLAMELLKGETLADRAAREGALAPSAVLELYVQLCHAIGAAHDAGIVHRDLKPENVFLAVSRRAATTASYVVKVLDFGIAKIVAEASTKHTAAIGTPLWMAPEQTEASAQIHPTADVWALGLIAFHLLTGRLYWRVANSESASAMAMMREVCFEPLVPASVRARELGVVAPPSGFDEWFARCVNREIGARFMDARAAGAALDAALRTAPATAIRTERAPVAPRVATELMPVVSAPAPDRPVAASTMPMPPHSASPTAAPSSVSSEPIVNGRNRTALVAVAAVGIALVAGAVFFATRTDTRTPTAAVPSTEPRPASSPTISAAPGDDNALLNEMMKDSGATPFASSAPATPSGTIVDDSAPKPAGAKPKPEVTAKSTVVNTDSTTKSEEVLGPTPGDCPAYKGGYSEAMKNKDFECVRTILLPRLDGGSISSGEARYLKAACTALGDTSCMKRAAEKIE